jgi:hypothetical protein
VGVVGLVELGEVVELLRGFLSQMHTSLLATEQKKLHLFFYHPRTYIYQQPTHTRTHTHTHTHIKTHAHTHTHTHILTSKHTHTHTLPLWIYVAMLRLEEDVFGVSADSNLRFAFEATLPKNVRDHNQSTCFS